MKKVFVLLLPVCLLFPGCAVFDQAVQMGVNTGLVSRNTADALKKTARTFQDITPEQEHYIGRTVAANILNVYKPYHNQKANDYINVLGQSLAAFSDRPDTFGGYHFMILETSEVNAFAAPGGFIFVSRGLLRCCKSEDAVAAVLAHEIAHVQHKHGLQSIKKDRLVKAFTALAAVGAAAAAEKSREIAQLTSTFSGSISDITSTMINSGYSRAFEKEADITAVEILKRIGYNPVGLKEMLEEMKRYMKPGGPGFAKTHPDPEDRIETVEPFIGYCGAVSMPKSRKYRFQKALSLI